MNSLILMRWLLIVPSLLGFIGKSFGDDSSRYVRRTPGADTAVVFVHGVLGDSTSTWGNGPTYWPQLLTTDSAFDGADIFVYSYPTSLWATLSIDELADYLRPPLAVNEVSQHRRLVFLTHSMGGLITRAYLLKNRDVAARTSFVYFYSTPTTGSQVATLATLLSRSPQLGKMKPMNADDYLADLMRQWLNAGFTFPSYCAYEKRNTYGLAVVTIQSASALCTKGLDPIDTNHIDIVKPLDQGSASYLAFKSAYLNEISRDTGDPLEAIITNPVFTDVTKRGEKPTLASINLNIHNGGSQTAIIEPTMRCLGTDLRGATSTEPLLILFKATSSSKIAARDTESIMFKYDSTSPIDLQNAESAKLFWSIRGKVIDQFSCIFNYTYGNRIRPGITSPAPFLETVASRH